MFVMTAQLWDALSGINALRQDVDLESGETLSDDRLPYVLDLLAGHEGDVDQVEHEDAFGTRYRIRLTCQYEGAPAVVVMGRTMMWVEE